MKKVKVEIEVQDPTELMGEIFDFIKVNGQLKGISLIDEPDKTSKDKWYKFTLANYNELEKNEKAIIVLGNLSDGFDFVGTFENFEDAVMYMENEYRGTYQDSWVATIHTPKTNESQNINC